MLNFLFFNGEFMSILSKWMMPCMASLVTLSSLFNVTSLKAEWNPPVFVTPLDLTGIGQPEGGQLDVNLANQGVVVFSGDDPDIESGFFKFIYSAAYTFGSGWSLPVRISSDETIVFPPIRRKYFGEGDPVVAMNLSGYCVSAWEGFLNTLPDAISFDCIITNIRSSDGTWSTVRIASEISEEIDCENPFVAVNDAGLAVMLWNQFSDETGFRVMSSFLPFNGNWTTPFPLDNQGNQADFQKTARVSIDPNGNVIGSWQSDNRTFAHEIRAATYDSATSLWTTVVLDPAPNIFSYTYNAIDPNGNAVVVWLKNIDAINNINQIWSASFTYGVGWSPAVPVSSANQVQNDANVTMDPFGNATATWGNLIVDINNVQTREVFASRKPLNGNWSIPVRISEPGNVSRVDNALVNRTIDVDNEGNVITVMRTDLGLQSAFYSVLNGWESPQSVNVTSEVYANIGLGTCRFALAEWFTDGREETRVQAADNFAAGILQAPLALNVRSCCQKFASQKRCFNFLSWDPAATCVASYRLYRNGVLIADIPVGGLTSYTDPICKKKNATYSLTYVNIYGLESSSVSITVR